MFKMFGAWNGDSISYELNQSSQSWFKSTNFRMCSWLVVVE